MFTNCAAYGRKVQEDEMPVRKGLIPSSRIKPTASRRAEAVPHLRTGRLWSENWGEFSCPQSSCPQTAAFFGWNRAPRARSVPRVFFVRGSLTSGTLRRPLRGNSEVLFFLADGISCQWAGDALWRDCRVGSSASRRQHHRDSCSKPGHPQTRRARLLPPNERFDTSPPTSQRNAHR